MKPKEAQKLIDCIREMVDTTQINLSPPAIGKALDVSGGKFVVEPKEQAGGPNGGPTPADFDKLYEKIKRRLLDDLRVDPVFVRLLASTPEIELTLEPRIVPMDGSSVKGRICRLVADGFFADAKRQAEVNKRLDSTGGQVNSGRLSVAMGELVIDGVFVREGDFYTPAPGLKITKNELVAR